MPLYTVFNKTHLKTITTVLVSTVGLGRITLTPVMPGVCIHWGDISIQVLHYTPMVALKAVTYGIKEPPPLIITLHAAANMKARFLLFIMLQLFVSTRYVVYAIKMKMPCR